MPDLNQSVQESESRIQELRRLIQASGAPPTARHPIRGVLRNVVNIQKSSRRCRAKDSGHQVGYIHSPWEKEKENVLGWRHCKGIGYLEEKMNKNQKNRLKPRLPSFVVEVIHDERTIRKDAHAWTMNETTPVRSSESAVSPNQPRKNVMPVYLFHGL